ncbi:hypothetical protein [Mucilaginibacter aquaedulcis]|uniref:hypothetical protein n=1 Tax=Mucilaginibacter aquaedulcis TaxID=1187081 RepID=UPI0025B4DFD3|nr:hypothetical protein [Mucilaginibacter aquaedulcis]MDN3548724.1 hypothetical protein [Mucilaginibacter aquaedulcis]
MIQLTVVSRVNEDKNFFFDIIFALHKLKIYNIYDIQLLFVGDILSRAVLDNCCRLAELLGLSQNVHFTRKSVRITDLPENVKKGYFIHFTIADFTGYSGVESISLGYKTIFYNIDKKHTTISFDNATICRDVDELVNVISRIHNSPEQTDPHLLEDNLRLKKRFLLSVKDRSFLKSILLHPHKNE